MLSSSKGNLKFGMFAGFKLRPKFIGVLYLNTGHISGSFTSFLSLLNFLTETEEFMRSAISSVSK